jgi:hypothetical protein
MDTAQDGAAAAAGASASARERQKRRGVSFPALCRVLQCSERELLRCLEEDARIVRLDTAAHPRLFHADGVQDARASVYMWLAEPYAWRVLDAILTQAEALGIVMCGGSVPVDAVVNALADRFPSDVVRHVLRTHTALDAASGRARTFDLRTVAVSRGCQLLCGSLGPLVGLSEPDPEVVRILGGEAAAEAGSSTILDGASAAAAEAVISALQRYPRIALADFMERWLDAVPAGTATASADGTSVAAAGAATGGPIELSLSLLSGLVLVDTAPAGRTGGPPAQTVRYFPSEALFTDPKARFAQLFSMRPRWLLRDLEPFLGDITGFGRTQGDLLLAHTRQTILKGRETLFSAR